MNRSRDYGYGEPGSIVAAIIDLLPLNNKLIRDFRLIVEAFVLTMLSVYGIRLIGVPEPGLIGIVLASAAMIPRLNEILEINRNRIWSEEGSGRRVNVDSIISGLGIFTGMFVAFLVIGIASSDAALLKDFDFILSRTRVDPDAVLSPERFAQGFQIFQHNLSVLVTLTALAFVYRSLGTMFALGWNAGVWGVTIVLFMGGGGESDLNRFLYGVTILIAILPHLLTEAASYLVGALAAIFLSRGISIYRIGDIRLNRVLAAVGVLTLVSIVLLVCGAALEHYVPSLVLDII